MRPRATTPVHVAQSHVVRLTDDIDGSDATETVSFSIDGVAYEIDLNETNAAALRESLHRFVQNARKAKTAPAQRPATRKSTGHDPKAVRAWGAANGIEMPARGPIPAAVVAQYHAAGN